MGWDGECNSGLEGTDDECALAVSRASCHAEAGGINICSWSQLQAVNKTAHSPCPCHQGSCTVALAVQVEEKTGAVTATVLLGSHVIVLEVDGCNACWYGDA